MRFTLIIAALVAISSAVEVDKGGKRDGIPRKVSKAMSKYMKEATPNCSHCYKGARQCLVDEQVQEVESEVFDECLATGTDCLATCFNGGDE